jgi:uncharacterized protein (DUF362 family)
VRDYIERVVAVLYAALGDSMDSSNLKLTRRGFVSGIAAAAGASSLGAWGRVAEAAQSGSLVARPPAGFAPLSLPGRVVKVSGKGDFPGLMHKNQLWPKPDVARRLLEKAMMELTGATNLVESMKRFVHASDTVAIKPNGIAGNSMATSFEFILPVVEACIAAGVPAENITVFEQYSSYLLAARVGAPKYDLPKGVKVAFHNNKDHGMDGVKIYEGITTKFCRQLMQASCVINMGLIKDHSICGYTGALKNITHGTIHNPEAHHAHFANPQIAMLYAHPAVTSRVRLHIADGMKLMYDKGPLAKDPNTIVAHGSVYVATDPVALDTLGALAVSEERKKHGLKPLAQSGRAPKYIDVASELGLGMVDINQIRQKSFEV